MLRLSRNIGESIVIPLSTGEIVTITVVGRDGNQIKLGITAPRHIKVHREEVWDTILKGATSPPKPKEQGL